MLFLSTFDDPLDRPPKTGKMSLSGLAAIIGNANILGMGDAPFPSWPITSELDDRGRKIKPEKKERIVFMDLILTPLRKVGEEVLFGTCESASTEVDGLRAREEVLGAACGGELSADMPPPKDESAR